MPDHKTPEALLIRREQQAARPRQKPPQHRWPASAFHNPQHSPKVRVPERPAQHVTPRPVRLPGTLNAKRLKVTTTLDAVELLGIAAPDGKPRVTLHIRLPDRLVTAEVAAKSLCKAQTAIRNAGPDNIAVLLQGNLVAGDVIAAVGLTAQPKAAKAPQPS